MGEMASSVAHELNQPLTAITNYCNGMVSRVRADSIDKDDLVAALQKTARQAERAGQIIHRIRAFVKRSEPQRQRAEARAIVDDAVELAGIELRRRNVAIHTYVAQRLPMLMVDPILIEQVVLNLLKNAAGRSTAPGCRTRAATSSCASCRATPEEGGVIEFSVTDMGPGMKEEVMAACTSLLSTKAEGTASACPCAARSSSPTAAGYGRRTSTMASRFPGVASRSPCPSICPSAPKLRPCLTCRTWPRRRTRTHPPHEPDSEKGYCLRGR
jgi:nitrogen fixation/metabolism regulation signal transduction histidine kinase